MARFLRHVLGHLRGRYQDVELKRIEKSGDREVWAHDELSAFPMPTQEACGKARN